MPQIKKPERKRKKNSKRSNQSTKYYSDHRWKELRAWYYRNFPLCEECLKNGISTPTEEIHHIRKILDGQTEEERYELLLDPNNLMSLCSFHHHQIHNKMRAEEKAEEKKSLYYQSGK